MKYEFKKKVAVQTNSIRNDRIIIVWHRNRFCKCILTTLRLICAR